MLAFRRSQVSQQLADTHIRSLLRRLDVKAVRLEFHRFRLLADRVERKVARKPDWAPPQESFDVLAPDRRHV